MLPVDQERDELERLGPRLREERRKRGWTLETLAERSGMSTSTLSRLESGKRQASLELLLPLTRQLGIGVDDLLASPARDPRVRRAAIRRGGMVIAPLTREESEVRAYKITYEAGVPEPALRTHEGHEWIYVLSGRLRLAVGEMQVVLVPGEAAEFDTRTPHRMLAEGARPAEVISLFNSSGERMHVLGATEPQAPETSDGDPAATP